MIRTMVRWLTGALLLSVTFYANKAQTSDSSEEDSIEYKQCSNENEGKICVPTELCVNGWIDITGKNIIAPRLWEDDECDRHGMMCCKPRFPTSTARPTIASTTITYPAIPDTEEAPDYTDWGASAQCGERYVNESATENETRPWEFPWSVVVFSIERVIDEDKELFLCGGTLIDDQVVLTAAECVHQRDRSNLRVHIGRWIINEAKEPFMQVIKVEKVAVHSSYSASNRVGNLALLFLMDPARIGPASNRVCLPDGQDLKTDSSCYVVGWMDKYASENRLLKLQAEHADRVICRNWIRQRTLTATFQLPEEHLCADYISTTKPCGWARGSTMVCAQQDDSKQFFLAGIASYSVGNCERNGVIDVFQSTEKYTSWIDDKMKENFRDTNYYRPNPPSDF